MPDQICLLAEFDQQDEDCNDMFNINQDADVDSHSDVESHPPLPQAPQQAPLQEQAADLSISAHFAALDNVVANRTCDHFVNDFQQQWKTHLPAIGHVVNSIRPGGHMQRERLKRKADHISRSAAETHSFSQVTNLSVKTANDLLSFVTHVSAVRVVMTHSKCILV